MNITIEKLQKYLPKTKSTVVEQVFNAINEVLPKYKIEGKGVLLFLSQMSYESNGFNSLYENMTYTTPSRIVTIFRKYIATEELAKRFVANPQKLANLVYAGRFGNGNEASGDGFRYRGRGIIHLTFKDNYKRYGDKLGIDLVNNPELAADIHNAFLIACEYWTDKGCNRFVAKQDVQGLTKTINGGLNGYTDRLLGYQKACLIFQ